MAGAVFLGQVLQEESSVQGVCVTEAWKIASLKRTSSHLGFAGESIYKSQFKDPVESVENSWERAMKELWERAQAVQSRCE